MVLGDVIRKWRRASDLDAVAAAARIGISQTTLYRLERGSGVEGSILAKVLTWLLSEGSK